MCKHLPKTVQKSMGHLYKVVKGQIFNGPFLQGSKRENMQPSIIVTTEEILEEVYNNTLKQYMPPKKIENRK